MAVGNTFGATALSSYGGFWISFAIVLIPAPVNIETELKASSTAAFLNSFGLFLMGWFIFTFILLLCTLRSTVAFFFLFFTLDMAFLLLGIGYLKNDGTHPQDGCIVAGGAFGLMAAFAAWYNALAGIADSSNRYVIVYYENYEQFANVEIASSSFLLRTFPGRTRAASDATRLTIRLLGWMRATLHRCGVLTRRPNFFFYGAAGR
jgi:hypothetical protein